MLVDEPSAEQSNAVTLLDAANSTARRFGVHAGQSIAEACALVSKLVVREVSRREVREALGRIAEMALAFGATVSIEAPDTVWVDITGAAHLAGGEEALASDLAERVRSMGHMVRVSVAKGPRLAQAFARWSEPHRVGMSRTEGGTEDPAVTIVPSQSSKKRMAQLPIAALPVDRDCVSWLMRLGVQAIGDLVRLPRASAASRLGKNASAVLDLCEGHDTAPLVAYQPPVVPIEETNWEDPVDGSQPLLFALRGLVARLSARLEGRGEAVRALELVIVYDRSIAKLRGADESLRLHFELTSPLWQKDELWRVIASKLERTKLAAPSVSLRLEAPGITRALQLQLDLSRGAAGLGNPENLPVLLAELTSDIGRENVGIFRIVDTHRPEAKSVLSPALPSASRSTSSRGSKRMKTVAKGLRKAAPLPEDSPTRLLPHPVRLEAALHVGATVSVEHRLYTIARVDFDRRLDAVEWWKKQPLSRDYLRLWLEIDSSREPSGADARHGFEATVYVDRETGARYLQAVAD